eukprot:4017433-Ditylum_brightwellii.AAC.1
MMLNNNGIGFSVFPKKQDNTKTRPPLLFIARGGEWGWLSAIVLSEIEICNRVGWWDGKAGEKLVQNNHLELGPK